MSATRTAVDGGDDDVVELRRRLDAAQRPQAHLPGALFDRAAGDLDVLLLNRVAHLPDGQAAGVELLDVHHDVDLTGAAAAERDRANAVYRFERALHLLVGDFRERADRHLLRRQDDRHDRVGVGVGLLDDGRQDFRRDRPHGPRHLFAHVVGGVVEVALEHEAHRDVRRATRLYVRLELVDAGDAAQRVLHRHDDRRGHLVG